MNKTRKKYQYLIFLLVSLSILFISSCEYIKYFTAPPEGLDNIPPGFFSSVRIPLEVSNLNKQEQLGSVSLSWKNPDSPNLMGIRISYKNPAEKIVNLPKTSRQRTFSGLTTGKEYIFKVQVITNTVKDSILGKWGESLSPGITIKGRAAPDTTPPGPIQGLYISKSNTAGANAPYDITLSWKNPTDPDFDHIESSFNGGAPVSLPSQTQSRTFKSLAGGSTYTFSFKTVDTSGNKSAAVSKTITLKNNSNPQISNRKAVALPAIKGFKLSWTNPGDPAFKGAEITVYAFSSGNTFPPVTKTYTLPTSEMTFPGPFKGVNPVTKQPMTISQFAGIKIWVKFVPSYSWGTGTNLTGYLTVQ